MTFEIRRLVCAAAFVLLVALPALAQNPFLGESQPDSPEIYARGVPEVIRDWSRSLQSGIADLARRVRDGNLAAGVTAFGLAILFGIVHIAGPGHGKVFAVSFFSGRDARPREGLAYSAIVNVIDSVAAFALVMLGYVILRTVIPSFRSEGPRILQLVAYGLIVVFGVAHLISHLRPHRRHDEERVEADGSHGDVKRTNRPPWMLAVSVGLVPCPVSTILLVYGIANDVLPFMILMVIGVSLGGFVTMSAISLAVIAGRSRLLAVLHDGAARWVPSLLEYLASGLIIVLGIVLFVGVL